MESQNLLSQLTAEEDELLGLTEEELEQRKKEKASFVDYKMVTFSLAGKDYAVDIMNVKEIAKAGFFTYVPNTLPFVLGVYNLRGEIIPIVDLRLFFNIDVPERKENQMENMLILRVGEQLFGVVVDAIDKVVGIQKSTIQPPHPLFGDINIKYIYGVVEANRRLYILLDIDRIFGQRNAEEEKELMDQIQVQTHDPSAMALSQETGVKVKENASASSNADVDFNFIVNSLKTLAKFTVNELTQRWAGNRYEDWCKTRGKDKTQLQNPEDANEFLKPFYSPCTGGWWTKQYADSVFRALPENEAKNIIVWNPGCGKGYESYSLACVLKKKYPEARIRIYAHDVDLLSVSNAPLLNISPEAAGDWFRPYVTNTVNGEFTFTKEIKDMVMFEYHDCVNTNALPPLDLIVCRDVLAFLPEESQRRIAEDFAEKLKGNGMIICGENEEPVIDGWSRKIAGTLPVYTK